MEAALNRVVSIIYELRKNNIDGEVVESLDIDRPLTFIFGKGQLLSKFEDNLVGRRAGDSFSFMLKSDEAYGPVQDNAIVDIPIQVFEIEGKADMNILQIGNVVPMVDREGRRLNGVVRGIGDDHVTMDFNHPMAGQNLYFKGEVTEVREATEEELSHGHIHSEGSCEGCNDEDCQSKKSSTDSCGGCS